MALFLVLHDISSIDEIFLTFIYDNTYSIGNV
jgi:hypothetical protein